uniref:Putative membrane protein n=1 Tax=Brassica napus TaxID=3708 RepID=I7D115_BRANA|nr:putative membrane protein [Brassica napus]
MSSLINAISWVLTLSLSLLFLSFYMCILKGEIWGWTLFYASVSSLAFGSAYYHLKPDDNRIVWDTLPILIAYSSLFSSFLVERAGERVGLSCLVLLLFISVFSVAYARVFNDLRLCLTFQLIPCLVIPVMTVLLPPKYTHSRFWLLATAAHAVSKIEGLADSKIYNFNGYTISGHSLGHLCSALAMVLLTVMLLYRSIRFPR